MSLDAAKLFFFEYDGSTFDMSRHGVEERYRAYEVPPETEAEWLEELVTNKLMRLRFDRNWRVLAFLRHHERLGHLDQILAAEPRGEPWEQCAFLEELLMYVRTGRRQGKLPQSGMVPQKVQQAITYVTDWCDRLLAMTGSQSVKHRIQAIQRRIEELDGR